MSIGILFELRNKAGHRQRERGAGSIGCELLPVVRALSMLVVKDELGVAL